MKLGFIVWTDKRDGNGIIKSEGAEYYFDSSVCRDFNTLKSGQPVRFEINPDISDCLCAIEVKAVIF